MTSGGSGELPAACDAPSDGAAPVHVMPASGVEASAVRTAFAEKAHPRRQISGEPEVPVQRHPEIAAESVLTTPQRSAFGLLTVINLAALGYGAERLIRFGDWERHPLMFWAVCVVLVLPIVGHQVRWFLLPLMKRPIPPQSMPTGRVAVATTFVPGAEPLALLERAIEALVALDLPHETWVLDEGDDDRVRELCRAHGARHFSRRSLATYQSAAGPFKSRTKYGNYNAWLAEHGFDEYDFVSAFDPDHIPDAAFLRRVLPYFTDPAIGYVQAAQAYANQGQSWVARGAAEETYDYFSTIQMASFGMGYPIIVGGHNTHRTFALRQIGGFAPHDADDVLTTRHYRDAGWHGVYVPEILARGLTPADLPAYLTQQRRWARSVLDLKLRACPGLSTRQPPQARAMGFLHGFNYLLKGSWPLIALVTACGLCLTGADLLLLSPAAAPPAAGLLTALALSEVYRQQFYLDPESERGCPWRAWVLHWARWPQMLLALGDVVRNRRVEYSITAKQPSSEASRSWLIPHLLAAAVLVACWLVGWSRGTLNVIHHAITAVPVLVTAGLVWAALCGPRCLTPVGNSKPLVPHAE